MVLESIINPFKAKKKPWEMFFLGLLYASVGLLLSLWVFREQASLLMVFLTTFACIPLLYSTMKVEEEEGVKSKGTVVSKLIRHAATLKFLMYLFSGFVVAYVFWYIILPSSVIQSAFITQSNTINTINSNVIMGNAINITRFTKIFFNNIKVMIFCILFSFIYGAGAIFILTWNGSVIATAVGNYIRTNLSSAASSAGFTKLGEYLQVLSIGLLKYVIHGIPEILAYFVAGLAGGIISVAVIKEHFSTKGFSKAMLDAGDLIILAVILTLFAAILEVWITPLIF